MMRVIFAGGWRGRWEGWLRALSADAISTPLTLAGAKALRDILWLAVRVRNALRRQPPVRLPVPVISVGNITVGGTGKTPLTRWLVHRLKEHGHRPAILTPLTADADEAQEHADAGLQPVYTGETAWRKPNRHSLKAQRSSCWMTGFNIAAYIASWTSFCGMRRRGYIQAIHCFGSR